MSDVLLKFLCDAVSHQVHRERLERESRTFVARFNAEMAKGDWWRRVRL